MTTVTFILPSPPLPLSWCLRMMDPLYALMLLCPLYYSFLLELLFMLRSIILIEKGSSLHTLPCFYILPWVDTGNEIKSRPSITRVGRAP